MLREIAKRRKGLPLNAFNIDQKKIFFRWWSKILEKDLFWNMALWHGKEKFLDWSMHRCIWFKWQDFGSRGAAGRSFQAKVATAPCWTQRLPAVSSRTTAEHSWSPSAKLVASLWNYVYLRKGKMLCSSGREVGGRNILLRRRSERAAGWGCHSQPRLTHHSRKNKEAFHLITGLPD